METFCQFTDVSAGMGHKDGLYVFPEEARDMIFHAITQCDYVVGCPFYLRWMSSIL
jgi:hypothetical protein